MVWKVLILWHDLRIVLSEYATYQSEECLYPGKQTVLASGYDRIITILVFGQSFQVLYQEHPIAFCPMIVHRCVVFTWHSWHPIPDTGTPFYLSHAVADLRCRRVTY